MTKQEPIGSQQEPRSFHNPKVPISDPSIFNYFDGGSRTRSGQVINPRTALGISPVWQALSLISGDIARLPIVLKRYQEDGRTKERALRHPVYNLLGRWTGRSTPNVWLMRVLVQALMFGNGYSWIRRENGVPVGLHWLKREQVEPDYDRGRYFYLVEFDEDVDGIGGTERISPTNMIHVQGLTLDEYGGASLIEHARHCWGRYSSVENYADDFFANDSTPSGWFEHPAQMSEPAQERFISAMNKRHRGAGNRFKLGILEEGMQWKTAGITPEDALMIEALGWGVKDVARFFSIPPHKLGDSDRVSYNSLEQEEQAYYNSTLGAWVFRLETELAAKLLFDGEYEAGYFIEFDRDRWQTADMAVRFQAYSTGIQWGILSRNEVREREGLNPYDGGDDYLTPLTHGDKAKEDMPQDETADQEDETTDQEDDKPNDETRIAFRDSLEVQLVAAAKLIANGMGKAAKRDHNFLAAVNEIATKFEPGVRSLVVPAARGISLALRRDDADAKARTLVDDVFRRAAELYLVAAECPPTELVNSVNATSERLVAEAADIATRFVYGDQRNGTTNNSPAY